MQFHLVSIVISDNILVGRLGQINRIRGNIFHDAAKSNLKPFFRRYEQSRAIGDVSSMMARSENIEHMNKSNLLYQVT
jgi:hypothetical protein